MNEGINFVFGHHKNVDLVRMECLSREKSKIGFKGEGEARYGGS